MRMILEEYTTDRQDLLWEVFTTCFELFRGNRKFGDFLALDALALSDTESQRGQQMNDIGNTSCNSQRDTTLTSGLELSSIFPDIMVPNAHAK